MQVYVIYGLVAALVGLIGINKKFGFWGYFFASILLTPVIGLLLVIASGPGKKCYKRDLAKGE